MPSDEKLKEEIAKEREQLEKQKQHNALDLKIPHNFEPTAPAHGTDTGGRNMFMQLREYCCLNKLLDKLMLLPLFQKNVHFSTHRQTCFVK